MRVWVYAFIAFCFMAPIIAIIYLVCRCYGLMERIIDLQDELDLSEEVNNRLKKELAAEKNKCMKME